MAIGSNNTTLKLDNVVATLFLEEMRWKNMEGWNLKEVSVRGRSIRKNKGKPSNGRYKSIEKLKSRSTRRCWTCEKIEHYKKDYKSKRVNTSKDFEEIQSTEGKSTQDEKGDVYLESTSTQS